MIIIWFDMTFKQNTSKDDLLEILTDAEIIFIKENSQQLTMTTLVFGCSFMIGKGND
jgi:hypothetical protein